jgi:hypothetical protein
MVDVVFLVLLAVAVVALPVVAPPPVADEAVVGMRQSHRPVLRLMTVAENVNLRTRRQLHHPIRRIGTRKTLRETKT